MDAVLAVAGILTGLLVLYTVVRLAVRDGVLDARAKDDADLALRSAITRSRARHPEGASLDDLLDLDGPT